MSPDLLGYLLNALEPEEQRQVEAYLATHPEARGRLQALRQAFAPLEAEREMIEPPPDLAERTLARMAEQFAADLPKAPRPVGRFAGCGRACWRRADLAVAAAIVFFAIGLGLSGLLRLRQAHDVVACQNNLREFFTALKVYSDQHHDNFPDIAHAAPPPRNVAGMVVPILISGGELPPDASVRCPGYGAPVAPTHTLDEVLQMSDEDFNREAVHLGCCYAYSLGYRDAAGQYHGPRFDPDQPSAQLPLMSDSPPLDLRLPNSPNHGGLGQNVLFVDGHVAFCTDRHVGVAGDDIFVNRANQVAAGLDNLDAVLGRSLARP
jgi:prepilin-type processing-associated H-X9-DG protein